MDPSLLPTTGPTIIHSPSEASYSSGPSRTSTRSTSPDTSSHRSSPLLDLHHLVTTSSIVPETTNALAGPQPSKMDKNSAPPADGLTMRRPSSKFNMERPGGPANYQQPQSVRPGAPMGPANLASRGLASNNWRAQAMADELYNNFDLANPQNQQQQQQQLHFGRPVPVPVHQQQLPAGVPSLYSPSDSMAFPDALLDSCYAYCYDRGNGHYTRLIPADMIPTLCDVPALQQGSSGMIVLPAPRALPANGRSSNVEPVMLKVSSITNLSCAFHLPSLPPSVPSTFRPFHLPSLPPSVPSTFRPFHP
ncbi:Chromatin remodeling factor m.t1.c1 [Apiospora hydei]|uniref:Chromatin remodeling factor m.t1.c1 n=1 Tax=Apiospora hydei TaxID=1337664 RepID=A0ABR1WMW0_9PEZI